MLITNWKHHSKIKVISNIILKPWQIRIYAKQHEHCQKPGWYQILYQILLRMLRLACYKIENENWDCVKDHTINIYKWTLICLWFIVLNVKENMYFSRVNNELKHIFTKPIDIFFCFKSETGKCFKTSI